MRPLLLVLMLMFQAPKWTFDSDTAGTVAKSFTNQFGMWQVMADPTAPSKPNVLAQLAKSGGSEFNVTLINGTNFKDVDVSVQMKAVAGRTDQGGGLVWRAKDGKNYYIARYNPLEDNFRVYRVEDGKRTQLATADVERKEGWRIVRVTMKGDEIACYLDGKKHLSAKDSTFKEAGKIGLWSKADAQSHFDDLTVKEQ